MRNIVSCEPPQASKTARLQKRTKKAKGTFRHTRRVQARRCVDERTKVLPASAGTQHPSPCNAQWKVYTINYWRLLQKDKEHNAMAGGKLLLSLLHSDVRIMTADTSCLEYWMAWNVPGSTPFQSLMQSLQQHMHWLRHRGGIWRNRHVTLWV